MTDANQNCVLIIRQPFLLRSLASLISILPSFRALFTPSIHPNLGLPLALLPSTFAFLTFFSSRSLSTSPHDRTISKHSFVLSTTYLRNNESIYPSVCSWIWLFLRHEPTTQLAGWYPLRSPLRRVVCRPFRF